MLHHANAIRWLVLVGVWLGCASSGEAARLLQFFVILHGQTNLHAYYQSGDTTPTEEVWRYLKSPPMMVEEASVNVPAEAGQPLQATLPGVVELKLCRKASRLAAGGGLRLHPHSPADQQ
jgi:hypothetical protein